MPVSEIRSFVYNGNGRIECLQPTLVSHRIYLELVDAIHAYYRAHGLSLSTQSNVCIYYDSDSLDIVTRDNYRQVMHSPVFYSWVSMDDSLTHREE
jgi:hypothetical protein